jgi:hypothetical protein
LSRPPRLPLVVCAAAIAACAGVAPRPEVAARTEGVSQLRLEAAVTALAGAGPRHGGDAAATGRTLEWLSARLRELGYEPELEPFEASVSTVERVDGGGLIQVVRAGTHHNLLATRRGAREPEVVVELGAHYDTVHGSPGADDNASGVAVVLEVARLAAATRTERSLRFCFYALEEEGLLGSRAHAQRVAARADERLDGVLVLDMVGYARSAPGSQRSPVRIPLLFDPPATADFVFLAGNWSSGALGDSFEGAARCYAPDLDVYGVKRLAAWHADGWRSDHASYWDCDLRAILLSDTAELRTPHYHRPSDTPDTLDYGFLTSVARATCGWALERARVLE